MAISRAKLASFLGRSRAALAATQAISARSSRRTASRPCGEKTDTAISQMNSMRINSLGDSKSDELLWNSAEKMIAPNIKTATSWLVCPRKLFGGNEMSM